MCSFLITNKTQSLEALNYANEFQKLRGPDLTSTYSINQFTFLHNLLSITGEFSSQPFVEEDLISVYNGEIYNFKQLKNDAKSDGEVILPLYKKYGVEFLKLIDGEFSLVIYDIKKNLLLLATDCFGSKPLFYSLEKDYIGVSSYHSALNRLNFKHIDKLHGNSYAIVDLSSKLINFHSLHSFDLDNEYKTDFKDWNFAFEESLRKKSRYTNQKIFVPLSEGYDSGAIACGLENNEIPFKSYSVNVQTPSSNILLWRNNINTENLPIVGGVQIEPPKNKNYEFLEPSIQEYKSIKDECQNKCEPISYSFFSNGEFSDDICIRDTFGFLGAAVIITKAKKEGYKILFSGLGGDVIGNNQINNLFRKYHDINNVIDFNDNNPYSSEYCCGLHGVEVRYPYLDKTLWQETLWLNKNILKEYKHPLRQYMLLKKYPFIDIKDGKEVFQKIGFYKVIPELNYY